MSTTPTITPPRGNGADSFAPTMLERSDLTDSERKYWSARQHVDEIIARREHTGADATTAEHGGIAPLQLLDLTAPEPETRWILPGWIEAGSITLLAGRAKVGKSTLLAEIARGIASGASCCLGMPTEAARVLWVDGDQGPRRVRRLFQRLSAADIPDLLAVSDTAFSLRDPDGAPRLDATIIEHKPAIIILDAWSTLTSGSNERDETEQTVLFRNLRRMCDIHGVAFLVIHHDRKRSKDVSDDPVEAIRGSSAIAACVDSIVSARPVAGGRAQLDLAVEAARHDERPRVRIERILDEDRILLQSVGPPEVADTKQASAETFIAILLEDGSPWRRGEIIETCRSDGHLTRDTDNALRHLLKIGALTRPARGTYQRPGAPPEVLL